MLAKTQETAMGAAFDRFGIRSEDAEFDVALAKYRNHGGTFERAIARCKKAFADELPGEGRPGPASNGHVDIAQPRQPNEDEAGQSNLVSNDRYCDAPSSSPDRGGEGHKSVAGNGQLSVSFPAREPSAAQRAASAKVEAASARAALSAMDRMKTSAGKVWGDVGLHELDGMYRDGTMAKAIKDWIGPVADYKRFLPIRELMNANQFELVLARVRGQNNAA